MNQTAPILLNRVPGVLIDYLWRLAGDPAAPLSIRLSARRLGPGMVQDIIIRGESGVSHRTVFGFDPVNASIEVRFCEGGCLMAPPAGRGNPAPSGGALR